MSTHSEPTPTPVEPSVAPSRKRMPNGNGGASPEQVDFQELLGSLLAMKAGDFSVRMRTDQTGIAGKIADAFNDIIATNQRMAEQLEKVGEQVGKQGKTRQRVKFSQSVGSWGDMESSVNTLIDDLLWPTAEVTRAIAAVAQGDLLQ